MASVFDTIKQRAGDAEKSATWYRSQVNKIASNTTARQLFRQNKLNGRPSVGRLNLFENSFQSSVKVSNLSR